MQDQREHIRAEAWHARSRAEVVSILETDLETGLSTDEARRRLEEFGPNRVAPQRAAPWWRVLLKQFADPLIYILLIAAAVALVFQDYLDMAVIAAVLVINATIGFIQELRARRAIGALARIEALKAQVVRESEEQTVASEGLVPGDIVVLNTGSRVPADVRLFLVRKFEADEAALTGESIPATKMVDILKDEDLVPGDQLNMAFSGTVITRGRAQGVVVRTGDDTEVGRIATAVKDVIDTKAPIQHKVERLGKGIGVAIAGLTILVATVGWIQARPLQEIVSMAIAMAVAAIPEALPVVLTVTLAVGVRRMAERNAIVRSLPAVETLGSTTVIGSDKTGTLTKNEMTVKRIWAGGSSRSVEELEGNLDQDEALRAAVLAAVLANEASLPREGEPEHGDPTELALLKAATAVGLSPRQLRAENPRLDLLPFESKRQFMASLHDTPRGRYVFAKGSGEAILERCDKMIGLAGESELELADMRERATELAAQGYRVLAMAYRPESNDQIDEEALESGFVFAGFHAMEDPLRPEVIDAVRDTRSAGVRVLMLTGDHAHTARAIGRRLELGGAEAKVVEGREVQHLDDAELSRLVKEVEIYARVAPEHKLRIVEILKGQGEVVAVTGDGVNDAPALRTAHLGVAMGKKGTDVAREAADMVLADDNFASITAAIDEGRRVFNNVRKVSYFLLSTGVGIVLTILFALFAGWPLPYLAVQVLWINLVTKGLQDVALAFEPGEPGQLQQPPRPSGEGVLNRPLLIRMVSMGVFMAVGTMIIFWWAQRITDQIELARSIAMTQMVIFQFFHVGNCRSLHRSIFRVPLFSNRFLFVSLIAAFLAQLAILYVPFMQTVFQTAPLTLEHWAILLLVGLSVIVVAELDKIWLRRRGFGPGLDIPVKTKRRPIRAPALRHRPANP